MSDPLFSHDRCLMCSRAGQLICCDACPAAAHVRCVPQDRGPINSRSDWFCPYCTGKRERICYVCDEPA